MKAFLGLVVALLGVIVLAVPGFMAGLYWDRRPPHFPSFHVKLLFGCCTWTAPESLKAQYDELNQAERNASIRLAAQAIRETKISAQAQIDAVKAHQQIAIHTRWLLKEVPLVITPQIDARFPMPSALIMLHDVAAIGDISKLSLLSQTAYGADETASPVKASRLSDVIIANYGECRIDQDTLTRLQDWAIATADNSAGSPH